MKHWIFNVQETNRGSESSHVDDKTAWELYYPPFQAAVEAGVSAAMCSYNKVDGIYACGSPKQLQEVLKKRMGFQGFVMTDWWALHSTAIGQGVDQEMPGTGQTTYFKPEQLKFSAADVIDNSVERVLSVVYRVGLGKSTKCSPPHCQPFFVKNMTSDAHTALARTLATESIVLLQNRGNTLPLTPDSVKTIAIVGGPAVAKPFNPNGGGQGAGGDWFTGDYYSGGGSGHTVAGYVVTPLDGIRRRAALAGMQVVASPNNDANAAIAAARQADVTIIVAATTSGESRDRPHLHLDHYADDFIAKVAGQSKHTIVLMQIPGAVLMPWRDSVSSILAMFMGGQETGNAWADVLFGDHAPTGRLPIMMPLSVDDTIEPAGGDVNYIEGMKTSYRNKAFKHTFPFGHGLTYTTFEYEKPVAGLCADGAEGIRMCISVHLRNTGRRSAKTIAQLYIAMPADAGHPAPILKGFQKTGIVPPGGTSEVIFRLGLRDLSYYDIGTGTWEEASGVTCSVGESSADIRHSLHIERDAGTGVWGGPSAPIVGNRRPPVVPQPGSETDGVAPPPAPETSVVGSQPDYTIWWMLLGVLQTCLLIFLGTYTYRLHICMRRPPEDFSPEPKPATTTRRQPTKAGRGQNQAHPESGYISPMAASPMTSMNSLGQISPMGTGMARTVSSGSRSPGGPAEHLPGPAALVSAVWARFPSAPEDSNWLASWFGKARFGTDSGATGGTTSGAAGSAAGASSPVRGLVAAAGAGGVSPVKKRRGP
mmetsp:Transcript_131308/g.280838  ORF Transcript_131308/g.280838 Transcript_131308/m.280838 type:complete len:763 (-) Transcript_131308:148-2436(-)